MEDTIEIDDYGLWLGSKASAYEYRRLKALILEKKLAGISEILNPEDSDPTEKDDAEMEDPLLAMYGSVAVICVEGILVSGEVCRWYNYGLVGYEDIRRATMCALGNKASEIVVHLKTPGGMVDGLGACSTFFQEVNKTTKVSFYCDSSCASAGVWLGCSTGPMVVGQYAEVGNVGVMRLLADTTKMYKDLGIQFDILKSTDLKGAGDGRIKLSSEARQYLQDNVDKWGNLFVEHLAANLKLSTEDVRTNIAIAKDWVGSELINLGIASKVMSFDKFIASKVNKSNNINISQQPTSSTRYAMSKQIIPTEGEDTSLIEALSADETIPVIEPATEAAATPSPAPAPIQGVAEMAMQLVALAAESAELKLKLAAAEADKEILMQHVEAAKPILRETAQGFSVRLGRPAPTLDSADLPTLVGMVTDLRAEFKKSIPVGQTSKTVTETEDDKQVDNLTSELTSRSIAASMPRKKGK